KCRRLRVSRFSAASRMRTYGASSSHPLCPDRLLSHPPAPYVIGGHPQTPGLRRRLKKRASVAECLSAECWVPSAKCARPRSETTLSVSQLSSFPPTRPVSNWGTPQTPGLRRRLKKRASVAECLSGDC